MKISFIGAGKVGTAFGKYLANNSVSVIYYLSKNFDSSVKAADYVNCEATENIKTLIDNSDIIFITTKDDQIGSVAKEIYESSAILKGKVFVQMSGALTSEILNILENKGAAIYSMHPLQTFSDIDKGVEDLGTTYFSLESKCDLNIMINLLKQINNPYFVLTSEQKVKYHLSACLFSNYLVTLLDFGVKMLGEIGINSDDGLKAMDPLIMATYNNVKSKGTKESLTGPIQRGDTDTLEKHLEQLDGLDLEVYRSLGKMTTERLVDDSKKQLLMEFWER